MKTYLCIDPGVNGGWAYLTQDDKVFAGDMSELPDVTVPADTTVVIENVPPFVGRFIPSSAAFKLGYSFGWCVGMFRHRKTVLVRPQEWQKTMALGTKGEASTSQWKNKLKSEAQRRYPENLKDITLKTADAFLLLSHARQANL